MLRLRRKGHYTYNTVPRCPKASDLARGIIEGAGNGNFSPGADLTRGQFLVMVMRAYGLSADDNPADNFTDAGNTYYTGYLAAAKRLGITEGTGNNKFAPGKGITRQEMITICITFLKN